MKPVGTGMKSLLPKAPCDSDNVIWPNGQSRCAERKAIDENVCAVDLDAKLVELEEKTRLLHLSKTTCVIATEYYNVADEHPSSGAPSEKGQKKCRKRDRNIWKTQAIEKNVLFIEEKKELTRLRCWTCNRERLSKTLRRKCARQGSDRNDSGRSWKRTAGTRAFT